MEDGPPALRADTLAILQQVLREKEEARERAAREAESSAVTLGIEEDWQASQFWYDEATCRALARELLALAAARHAAGGAGTVNVACLACPSAYKALRALGLPPYVRAWVFEVDTRFGVFGEDFVHYDFNAPLRFPEALRGSMDVVIMDPPFINRDCLRAFARTALALRRGNDVRLLLCTGAVMLREARLLLGARPMRLHVGHVNRLSNPFSLYINYDDAGRLGGVAGGRGGGGAGGGRRWRGGHCCSRDTGECIDKALQVEFVDKAHTRRYRAAQRVVVDRANSQVCKRD
jgi:hypothetical protein